MNRFGIKYSDLIDDDPPFNKDDFIGYHSYGANAINQVIEQLNQREIHVYFVPRFPVKTVYDDFGFNSLYESSQFRLRSISNIPEHSNDVPENNTVLEYNVHYNPDVYPPPDPGYYIQINLEMTNQQDRVGDADGFYTTIFYGMYTWFNEFDWDKNLWNRPLCIYIDKDKNWKIHPGRARTSFVQFLETDTPLMMLIHQSIDMQEYLHNAIRITDIEQLIPIMRETSGFDDIDFYIRNFGYIADAWYTTRMNKQSFTGEIFYTYFGEKLIVKLVNDVIIYNNEPVAYVKDGLIYFNRSAPKFNTKGST